MLSHDKETSIQRVIKSRHMTLMVNSVTGIVHPVGPDSTDGQDIFSAFGLYLYEDCLDFNVGTSTTFQSCVASVFLYTMAPYMAL